MPTNVTLVFCTSCEKDTPHSHVHDCAYDLVDTHMSGSERYVCEECGHSIFSAEGKAMGLKFVLDK